MAVVQGVHQTSWRNQTSPSPSDQTPLIELSNALNKLNYDTNSFINNPDFISFLAKELSSRHISYDTKNIENGAVDKLKDNSHQNNQSYFDYALLQELLLSWNCYCTINIYPKLNSQEIQHNLVFDTCLGEKQIPDNVASFIKNLLDRGTDMDFIINLLMAIQSGKHIDTSNIQQKRALKKNCQADYKINTQINHRKHVHFSSTLCEESNFEFEKPILPPKKSTFKNPFKPLLQIKYRPFSKSPFRPSTRPPPPPAPIAKTEETSSTNVSTETSSLSPSPFCPQTDVEEENETETNCDDKSNKKDASEKTQNNESEHVDNINFIDGDDQPENHSSVKSQENNVESIQTKEVMPENDLINNNDLDINENFNEKAYTVTKIQPVLIEPIAINVYLDTTECLDSNNNSKISVENYHVINSENKEFYKQTNKMTYEDKLAPIAEIEPIYDLDLIEKEFVKIATPPVPPPRKRRISLLLSQSTDSVELTPTISPIYSYPHSFSLPYRPIPPPRKHRPKYAHTLPKVKKSHQEYLMQDPNTTLPKTSKSHSSHLHISKTQPLLESECAIALSIQSTPIPPPRRRRPTAPNNPFKIQFDDSDQVSKNYTSPKKKYQKKKSLKEQFIKTTESIKDKAVSTMSQIYNACKKIF